jgi:hypothetical protein
MISLINQFTVKSINQFTDKSTMEHMEPEFEEIIDKFYVLYWTIYKIIYIIHLFSSFKSYTMSKYNEHRYKKYLMDFYLSNTEYNEILYVSKFSVCYKNDDVYYNYYSKYATADEIYLLTIYAKSVDDYVMSKIYLWFVNKAIDNLPILDTRLRVPIHVPIEIRNKILEYLTY